MLKDGKYFELVERDPRIGKYYVNQGNGFWKAVVPESECDSVKKIFIDLGFSALNFTDSRSSFQFYNLSHLWDDIQIALKKDLKLLHLATEPIRVSDLYKYLTGKDFKNELTAIPAKYDYRTCHSRMFGKDGYYLYNRETVLKEIREFIDS